MRKVLVIDDEQLIRGLVAQVLEQNHFAVETAENGAIGIDKFDCGQYDLVITDICMPETDGHRVVDHIRRSIRSATPVIGMSGTPWQLTRHSFDQVLPKPFPIGELVAFARGLTTIDA